LMRRFSCCLAGITWSRKATRYLAFHLSISPSRGVIQRGSTYVIDLGSSNRGVGTHGDTRSPLCAEGMSRKKSGYSVNPRRTGTLFRLRKRLPWT